MIICSVHVSGMSFTWTENSVCSLNLRGDSSETPAACLTFSWSWKQEDVHGSWVHRIPLMRFKRKHNFCISPREPNTGSAAGAASLSTPRFGPHLESAAAALLLAAAAPPRRLSPHPSGAEGDGGGGHLSSSRPTAWDVIFSQIFIRAINKPQISPTRWKKKYHVCSNSI